MEDEWGKGDEVSEGGKTWGGRSPWDSGAEGQAGVGDGRSYRSDGTWTARNLLRSPGQRVVLISETTKFSQLCINNGVTKVLEVTLCFHGFL